MNIDDLTLGQVRELQALLGGAQKASTSLVVGKQYFIRTVTMNHTGLCIAVTDTDVVLKDAAWIADTGRFSNALKTGVFEEVEPFPDQACVSRAAIVDFCEWTHPLPRTVK